MDGWMELTYDWFTYRKKSYIYEFFSSFEFPTFILNLDYTNKKSNILVKVNVISRIKNTTL
jgi:hypothetical protein